MCIFLSNMCNFYSKYNFIDKKYRIPTFMLTFEDPWSSAIFFKLVKLSSGSFFRESGNYIEKKICFSSFEFKKYNLIKMKLSAYLHQRFR